jgi:hypothetical protein
MQPINFVTTVVASCGFTISLRATFLYATGGNYSIKYNYVIGGAATTNNFDILDFLRVSEEDKQYPLPTSLTYPFPRLWRGMAVNNASFTRTHVRSSYMDHIQFGSYSFGLGRYDLLTIYAKDIFHDDTGFAGKGGRWTCDLREQQVWFNADDDAGALRHAEAIFTRASAELAGYCRSAVPVFKWRVISRRVTGFVQSLIDWTDVGYTPYNAAANKRTIRMPEPYIPPQDRVKEERKSSAKPAAPVREEDVTDWEFV